MLVHEILAFEVRIERIFEVFSSLIQAWNFQAFLAALKRSEDHRLQK